MGANPVAYPGAAFAAAQAAAYPDIKPIEINRSADEAFELAADAIRRLKMNIVRQDPPDLETGRPGIIEVVDRTLILGFYDDVVIRVAGNDEHARIDVRSASRYGRHDLGRNAERVRQILKEIVVRMESVVPAARTKERPRPKHDGQRGTATQSTFAASSQVMSPRSARCSMWARSDSVAAPATSASRSR